MTYRTVSSIHELTQIVDDLMDQCELDRVDEYSYASPILFRGQSRASWSLDTTLERFGLRNVSMDDYVHYLAKVKPAVEAYTGKHFDFHHSNARNLGYTFFISQQS